MSKKRVRVCSCCDYRFYDGDDYSEEYCSNYESDYPGCKGIKGVWIELDCGDDIA